MLRIPCLALLAALALACSAQSPERAETIKKYGFKLETIEPSDNFKDLEPMVQLLANAQVVGMGEATHGTHEFFQMKHRMFRFLVERMGFTVFAIEASMPDCVAMDRYVTTGFGSPELAASLQGFWTWSTEEVRDLLKWMREYNLDQAHTKKLRVVGFDMQNRLTAVSFLYSQCSEYKVSGLSEDEWQTVLYKSPDDNLAKKLDAAIANLIPKIEAKEGKEPAEFAKRIATVYRQASLLNQQTERFALAQRVLPDLQKTLKDAKPLLAESSDMSAEGKYGLQYVCDFANKPGWPADDQLSKLKTASKAVREYATKATSRRKRLEAAADFIDYAVILMLNKETLAYNYRDKCMADNIAWIAGTYLPGQKIMLWAHNGHIGNAQVNDQYRWMGSHLTEMFKDKYYPIGFTFNIGSFIAKNNSGRLAKCTAKSAISGSVEEILRSAKWPLFILPFDNIKAEERQWIDTALPMRVIGAVFNASDEPKLYMPAAVGKAYRAVIYIEKSTPAKQLSFK